MQVVMKVQKPIPQPTSWELNVILTIGEKENSRFLIKQSIVNTQLENGQATSRANSYNS